MKIHGFLVKSGNYWAVEVPLMLIHTQGRSKREAYAMAKDAIEELVDKPGFQVEIIEDGHNEFVVRSNNDIATTAFILKQQRASFGLSIRDVAKKLGSSSPRAYSQYEDGSTKPNIELFLKILRAINTDAEPVFSLKRKRA